MKFLLYGAYGYTGKLIAGYANQYGLSPVLAGRNEQKLRAMSAQHQMPFEVVELNNKIKLEKVLSEVPLVLHAAGPFIHTARPMMEACLKTRTHYLDITGEMAVFEMAHQLDQQAKDAGIMLMPGTGFDVVPTDCTAVYLKEQLPDATHLKLAFATVGGKLSHGTALTMAENLGEKGAVRKDGRIVRVPLGHKTLRFPAGDKKLFAMTIPWGDVSTAWYSTGIPNIEVYTGVPPSSHRKLTWMRPFNFLLRTEFIRNLVKKRIEKQPAGPSDEQREKSHSFIWGTVKNEAGQSRETGLKTPDGYSLTAMSSLIIAKKVLNGDFKTGFQTPAKAYGSGLVMEIEGVERRE